MPVDPVSTRTDGSLALPASGRRAGWWAAGADPGAGRGTVVIAAHVGTAAEGPAPFAELAGLVPGDQVVVTTADGVRRHYAVSGRRTYRKAALPADVFARSGAPRLALVTCGGTWDARARSYDSNVVVWAVPAQLSRG